MPTIELHCNFCCKSEEFEGAAPGMASQLAVNAGWQIDRTGKAYCGECEQRLVRDPAIASELAEKARQYCAYDHNICFDCYPEVVAVELNPGHEVTRGHYVAAWVWVPDDIEEVQAA